MSTASRSFVSYWVAALAFLVFSMIVIGGLTRLTESGLSIVEWKLVSGILPPLTEQSWQQEFDAYRQSPQYQKVNKGMSVSDFKNIFWLEYLHRLLGRTIGLVVLLPLLWLTASSKTFAPVTNPNSWFLPRMWWVTFLIGLQGAIGWYMVKSGLIDVPWVSPYRLALHLGLAMIILLLLTTTWMRLQDIRLSAPISTFQTRLSFIVVVSVFVQILLGAFVAGLDAGLTYNTFPLMDGDLVPNGLWTIQPTWRNLFENVTMVNFLHRWVAFGVGALILFQGMLLLRTGTPPLFRYLAILSMTLTAVQIALGISTLLLVVPVHLATTHQAVAALLLISVNIIAYLSWQNAPKQMPNQTLSASVSA